jgi:hypothetical protein
MRFFVPVLLVALAVTTSRVDAESVSPPASQPAAASTTQQSDFSTPRAMMLSYDALAGAGPQAFEPFYLTQNADDQRLVRAEARTDAMLGMLQLIVEKKWGKAGVDPVLHAFGSKTHSDIVAAKVKVDGDRATLIWADDQGDPPVEMVKSADGRWQIDAGAMRKQLGESVDSYVASMQALSPIISDIADAIDGGKLTTPAAAAAETQRRIAALRQ